MNLSKAPAAYDRRDQDAARTEIAAADGQTYKHGQDVEIQAKQRFILVDTVTGTRYRGTMVSGTLTWTAI
jgi:hypothetical protein